MVEDFVICKYNSCSISEQERERPEGFRPALAANTKVLKELPRMGDSDNLFD